MMKDFQNDGRHFIIKHNVRGESMEEWVQSFLENEERRIHQRRNNTVVSHVILAFSREDTPNISKAILQDIGKEYIRLFNPRSMCVVVPHYDKAHIHLHFCFSGIEYMTGKTMRISRQEFQKLKDDVQIYQRKRYPELYHSIVNHHSTNQRGLNERDGAYYANKKNRKTRKEKIRSLVREAFESSGTVQELTTALQANNMKVYYRNNKLSGIVYKNRNYRLGRLGFEKELTRVLQRDEQKEKEQERDIEK